MLLSIDHTNVYRYVRPVEFTIHKLMLRPLEGHDVQVESHELELHPNHELRWEQDVFGNSVAQVNFSEKSAELRIRARSIVKQYNVDPFQFILEIYTNELPFDYPPDLAYDLAPYSKLQHAQDEASIREWLRPFLDTNGRGNTLDFLTTLNRSVSNDFEYRRREEPGVRSPAETLRSRSGSCRDFAFLFMEAARCMGLAARYVSGYLCGTAEEQPDVAADATHAWTEIYLPGGGWRGFDPTCGILAAGTHVRVAATRDPTQATPIRGNYLGDASLFESMEVNVRARVVEDGPGTRQ